MAVTVLLWLLFGVIVGAVNKRKTGGRVCGCVLGWCLGPIGLLLSLVMPYRPDTFHARREAPQQPADDARHDERRDRFRLGLAVAIVVCGIVALAVAVL
ncbi:MAG: hypothetical protein OXJ62_14130 [Spirochaetaceae bacterium]|nr:hypothetical protein [Spirochaetaceae bacterium]